MANPRIEFRSVGKEFNRLVAVQNVTLAVNDGEVVSLIGPSGCGKSTLLHIGSGLYSPSSGEVYVDGERVRGPNRHVAFMLQKDLLLPWRTIRENVEFGLEIRGIRDRRERSLALLTRFHLNGFENAYPHQLSGGMRQRAALARTLAVEPTVLLLDEPFSALDAQTKMVLQQDLAETLADEQKTAFFITHDLSEAVVLSDRILVMSSRPGTIIDEIKIDLADRANPMVRRREQQINSYLAHLMEILHVQGRRI
jgi:NitT/TauT family transport system ATP-binding protein